MDYYCVVCIESKKVPAAAAIWDAAAVAIIRCDFLMLNYCVERGPFNRASG